MFIFHTFSIKLNSAKNGPILFLLALCLFSFTSITEAAKVGGTIKGLKKSVTLSLNGLHNQKFKRNGKFKFKKKIPKGADYNVEITDLPFNRACYLANRKGTVKSKNIKNIKLTCEDRAVNLNQIKPVSKSSQYPSVISTVISVTDRDNNDAVLTGLKINDFIALEDGSQLTSESFIDTEPLNQIPSTFKTVLMLDISSSISFGELDAIKTAAKALVQEEDKETGLKTSKLSNDQYVTIQTFDDTVRTVISDSNDADAIATAIDNITRGGPSTNLFGAAISGANQWADSYELNHITKGVLFILTDGVDTAGSSTIEQVNAARGIKDVFALSIGGGPNSEKQLAAITGSAARVTSIDQFDADQIAGIFKQFQDEANDYHRGKYLIRYASPKRSGEHTFKISLKKNKKCPANSNNYCSDSISGVFNANGFSSVTPEIISYGDTEIGVGESSNLKLRTRWSNDKPDYEWVYDEPLQTRYEFSFTNSKNKATIKALKGGFPLDLTIYDCNYRTQSDRSTCVETTTVKKTLTLHQPPTVIVYGLTDGNYTFDGEAYEVELNLLTVSKRKLGFVGPYTVDVAKEQLLNASVNGGKLTLTAKKLGKTKVTVINTRYNVSASFFVNIDITDSDGDGVLDPFDDYPDDGHYQFDSDGDGMPDKWEEYYQLNPLNEGDATLDSDGDGVSNLDEFLRGTSPKDADTVPLVVQSGDKSITVSWDPYDPENRYDLCIALEPIEEVQNCTVYSGGYWSQNITSPWKTVTTNGLTYYLRLLITFPDGSTDTSVLARGASWGQQLLNDTGVTTCSDGTYNGLPCPVTGYLGQDAESGRDVTHNDDSDGRAGFSFTKLDANGQVLSADASEWSCVKDNVTGLIWERKQGGNGYRGDEGLHDADDRFNWYEPDDTKNGGHPGYQDDDGAICYGYDSSDEASWCNTYAFAERVNNTGLCGYDDWRVPLVEELHNLMDYSIPYPGPTIDTDYFPSTYFKYVWSSSSGIISSEYARFLYFNYGGYSNRDKDHYYGVRLVRGGQ